MNNHYKAMIYTILSIGGISAGTVLAGYLPLPSGTLTGLFILAALIFVIYRLFRASFSTNKTELNK